MIKQNEKNPEFNKIDVSEKIQQARTKYKGMIYHLNSSVRDTDDVREKRTEVIQPVTRMKTKEVKVGTS